jgi:hypothetical protein
MKRKRSQFAPATALCCDVPKHFGNGENDPSHVRGDEERRAPISVSFARAVQLGDETTRQVGRAEPAAPVPKSSFHTRARGVSTFHDFELVHGATLLVQHEEHGRGDLEDSVDAAATAYRLAQVQLRHIDVAATETCSSGMIAG